MTNEKEEKNPQYTYTCKEITKQVQGRRYSPVIEVTAVFSQLIQ